MKYALIVLFLVIGDFSDPARINELEQKAQSSPDDWKPRLELVEVFIDQENFGEAKKYLLQTQDIYRAGKMDSCNAEYFYLWGLYSDLTENIPSALGYYNRTIECDSSFSDAWRKQGYIHEIFGNYDKMLYCFEQSLKSTDDSSGVFYDIGVTCDYLDSLKPALDYYYASLRFGDIYPQTYLNIGVDWGMLGYSDSASYYFELAVDHGLQSPELYYNIGVIMFESGAYEQAMDNFMKILTIDPDFSAAKFQLGNVYEILGDSGMAKVYFEEFVQTAPLIYSDDIKTVKEKLIKYTPSDK